MDDSRLKAMLLFVSVGTKVLSGRMMLLLCLFLAFSLFAWAMFDPNYMRIGTAALFAVLVWIPVVRIDRALAPDRALVTPKEQP